jgi:ABC-type glycerol-3-phosphate transport system substrate-binding protein
MTIRTRIALLVILMLPVMLMSCGKKDDGVLRIALDIEDRDRYDSFFETFEQQNPDISIEATYGQDIFKLIGTKDEPDLFKTGDAYIEGISEAMTPLDPFIHDDDTFDVTLYHENIIESLKVDGVLYALPTSINTSLLYYNKALFDASEDALRDALNLPQDASVYPDETWTYDDFRTAGVTLTLFEGEGVNRVYTQFGAETQSRWWGEWLIYVRHFGGTFYVPGNNRLSALDSAEALQGTRFMCDKSMGDDTQKFAPDLFDPELSFSAGNVAMIFGGHMGDWASYDAVGLDWDIEVLPTPVGRPDARGGEIATDAFGISARSDNKDKAWRFLKYWVSSDGAKAMVENGKIGALKSMPEIIDEVDPLRQTVPDNIEAVFEAMAIAMPLPKEKDFERVVNMRVMDKIQIMLSGGLTPEAAMEAAFNAVNKYYRDLYGDN